MKTKKSSLDSTIETVEWKLPELRVESPSTTVWGRLSQAMRHACGMILIRRPKTSLLQIAAQYLSEVRNSFLISSDSSIPLKGQIRIETTHQVLSDSEELVRTSVYLQERLQYRSELRMSLRNGVLDSRIFLPAGLFLLRYLREDSTCLWGHN